MGWIFQVSFWRPTLVVGVFIAVVAYFERDPGVWGVLGILGLGYIVAWNVPVVVKHRHIENQDRLLSRCRALLMFGEKALDDGDRAACEAVLARIRRIERVLKLGDSWAFRSALTIWAVTQAILACVLVRFAGMLLMHLSVNTGPLVPGLIAGDLAIAAIVSTSAPIHAIASYFHVWRQPWIVENCGDRLHRSLFGSREVSKVKVPNRTRKLDGLTPEEMFGLSADFTRRQLDRARRKFAREFHPDLWHSVTDQERRAREDAMKRVNAAYDLLRPRAR